MTAIIPRWEWRTFGDDFGPAESAFGQLTPTGVQESDELYLLSDDADTVKVRGGLMDIKELREVNSDGLERWEPTFKAGFPLAAGDVQKVARALRVDFGDLKRESYTQDQLLDELLKPISVVRPVNVHKRRVRYTVNGCTSEVSEVVADGLTTRTVAIESEDGAAVVEAVQQMGFAGFVNTSYPKGLKALLDGRPQLFAVIDVGTNSVKFHVAERRPGHAWQKVVDRAEVTRLGEGMQANGEITPEARDRTQAAIDGMVDEALGMGVIAIAAAGTEGLRAALNSTDIIQSFRERSGITVNVLSGDDEARLAYVAAIASTGFERGSVVVFDTGGGSSQFSFGHGRTVDERFSVPVGAVKYTERFGLDEQVSVERLREARAAIAADLERIADRPRADHFIVMGGAVTNLAAVKHQLARYDPDIVHGTVLDQAELEREIELFSSRSLAERRQIVGLQPARAEVIVAGACIVLTVMELLGQESLTVCDRGLRHGLLDERFGAQ